jgi:hypothetical protein
MEQIQLLAPPGMEILFFQVTSQAESPRSPVSIVFFCSTAVSLTTTLFYHHQHRTRAAIAITISKNEDRLNRRFGGYVGDDRAAAS